MRKFVFALPACAILLAAAVLTSEFGSSLSAQTPDPVAESYDEAYAADDSDITAATWTETAIKSTDTRKSRIPPGKAKKTKGHNKKK